MDMRRTVEPHLAARRDGLILALVLAPGLAVAGLLFGAASMKRRSGWRASRSRLRS